MKINIKITNEAIFALNKIKEEHKNLVFMISEGCCDNMAPMLLEDFIVGDNDILIGEVAGIGVYASKDQANVLEESNLEIGVARIHGGSSFSLETSYGYRFTMDRDLCYIE
jgi:hypothetical protein